MVNETCFVDAGRIKVINLIKLIGVGQKRKSAKGKWKGGERKLQDRWFFD